MSKSNTKLPIENPFNDTIRAIQDVLSKHSDNTLELNPTSFFAFKGALEHATYSLKLIESLPQDTDSIIAISQQLKTLIDFEW